MEGEVVTGMQAITTAFTTAVGTIATDATSLIAAAIPVVLPVGGAIIALSVGWSVTKRFIRKVWRG